MIRQYMCIKDNDRFVVVSTRNSVGKRYIVRDAVAFDSLGNLMLQDSREKRRKGGANLLRDARHDGYAIIKTELWEN